MSSPSHTTVPQRRSGVLAQPVKAGDPTLVLLNPRSGQYYTLEAVGTRIWELCDGKRTIADIAAVLGGEYEESPDIIVSDVVELVKELMDEELLASAT